MEVASVFFVPPFIFRGSFAEGTTVVGGKQGVRIAAQITSLQLQPPAESSLLEFVSGPVALNFLAGFSIMFGVRSADPPASFRTWMANGSPPALLRGFRAGATLRTAFVMNVLKIASKAPR